MTAATATRGADRPLLGIVLMLLFCILAPLGDSIAKLLGGTVGIGLLVLTRFGLQAAILLPLVAWRGDGGTGRMLSDRRLLALVTLRTLLHILGLGLMFTALRFLPVADAIAIAFVMPFLLLLFGWAVLGEEIGPHRLSACVVGFLGVLLVLRPNFVEVGAPALLPLGVAVVFSGFILVTRRISRATDPVTLQAMSGVQATALLVVLLLVVPADLRGPLAFGRAEAGLLLLLGVIGTLAHLVMTWSLRFAPAATLAPMQYLEIPFATLIGWLMFRDLPDGLAALGITVTIGAGLYVIARERAISLRPPPAP